jgi:hypothetical protein
VKSGINWRGGQVSDEIERRLADALVEIGQRTEGEAKKELYPGHGKVTGTLQRSIHAASPDYNFSRDNVEPGSGSPERGGGAPQPKRWGSIIRIAVGSGMEYAMAIHLLYHYLINGYNKVRAHTRDIVRRHVAR